MMTASEGTTRSIARLGWLAGLILAGRAGADLVEQARVADAEAFGWSALPGARLEIAGEARTGPVRTVAEPGENLSHTWGSGSVESST